MGLLLRSTVPALVLGGALGLAVLAADPFPPGSASATPPAGASATGPTPAPRKDGFDLLSVPSLPDSWSVPRPAPATAPAPPPPLIPALPVLKDSSRPLARVVVPEAGAAPSLTPRAGGPGQLSLPPLPLLGQQAAVERPRLPALWPTSQGSGYRPFKPRVQEAPRVTSGVVFLEEEEPARMIVPTLGYGPWSAPRTQAREEPARPSTALPAQAVPLKWSIDEAEGKTPSRAPKTEAPRPFRPGENTIPLPETSRTVQAEVLPAPLDARTRSLPETTRAAQTVAPRPFQPAPLEPPSIVPLQTSTPVNLKQLKKQVSETAGRLARRVEVRQGPEGTVVVHVVTISATAANYLAERILQLPEMNAPTIRLDMKVDQ